MTINSSLAPGQSLQSNQSITSPNGRYMLIMQNDGNLVVYKTPASVANAIWASNTAGSGGKQVIMQMDGNLVVYKGNGTSPADAVWASNTVGPNNSLLLMQDDGNLVIYVLKAENSSWASNTVQP